MIEDEKRGQVPRILFPTLLEAVRIALYSFALLTVRPAGVLGTCINLSGRFPLARLKEMLRVRLDRTRVTQFVLAARQPLARQDADLAAAKMRGRSLRGVYALILTNKPRSERRSERCVNALLVRLLRKCPEGTPPERTPPTNRISRGEPGLGLVKENAPGPLGSDPRRSVCPGR